METVKNIIIINDSAHLTGGAGAVALSTAKALANKGYHVVLFSAMSPIEDDLLKAGVEVVCLRQYDILTDPSRLRAIRQGLWNRLAVKRFDELLRKYNPQNTIIHFHAWMKALSPALFSVTARYSYKIVVTLHDYFLFCPNGGLFNYQTQKICAVKALSAQCLLCNCDVRSYPQKVWRFVRSLVQTACLKKNRDVSIISISLLNKNVSMPYLRNIVRHWYYLNNPIDLNQKDWVSIERNDTYLFIARLSSEKGIHLFCQAITDLGLKGCVLGNGYLLDEYRIKYPNIHFAGWVNGEEKDKLIRKGKALIFPSLWYEGAPLTILEMKSYGIPCIVPDRCAASEQVEDGETGFIFKTGNLDSLKDCIQKYENADILYFQQNLKRTFHSQDYLMDTHIKGLIDIYNEILE